MQADLRRARAQKANRIELDTPSRKDEDAIETGLEDKDLAREFVEDHQVGITLNREPS